jgi:hypothetical protein
MTNMPSRDSKSDLLDAARVAIQDREEKAAEAALAARNVPRRGRMGVLILLGLAGSVLLVLQPTWLVGPKQPPPETAPVAAASLRLALVRQHTLIVAFSKTRGRLPANLAEVGDSVPGVRYQQVGTGAFRLTANAGDSIIMLESTDSIRPFLGQSIGILRNRGQE